MPEINLDKDLALLLALIEDPLATEPEIQSKLDIMNIKMSRSTINRRLKRLVEDPDSEDSTKPIAGATCVIDYNSLNMQVHTFLIKINPNNWSENIKIITDKICYHHPYTLYRNTIFGDFNGLFIQFVLPKNKKALDNITELFEFLIKYKIILDFEHYPFTSLPIEFAAKLSYWDDDKKEWKLDIKSIKSYLNPKRNGIVREHPISISKLDKLDMFDMLLLRELTINSRRTQSQILNTIIDDPKKWYSHFNKNIPTSKQSTSRRLALLNNEIILKNRLLFDRKKFSIFNQILYLIKTDDQGKFNLKELIKNDGIPFPGSMSFSKDYALLWMNLPPNEQIFYTELFTSRFEQIRVFMFGSKQRKYYFWHDNFDPESKMWKTSKEYMFDSVIQPLLEDQEE